MRLGAETVEQIKLFDWIRTRPDIEPFAMHIPMERKCGIQQGKILKRMGAKAGTADIFIAIPSGDYHGLFIELKADGGRISPKQAEFLELMTKQGYLAVCCVGYEASRSAILAYLGEPRVQGNAAS